MVTALLIERWGWEEPELRPEFLRRLLLANPLSGSNTASLLAGSTTVITFLPSL